MIPEQIRQIAEEYAEFINPDAPSSSLPKGRLKIRQGCIEFVYIPLLEYLNERYCLVERSKVVEMYQQAQVFYEDSKETYWAGQADFCESLFGSETFNK